MNPRLLLTGILLIIVPVLLLECSWKPDQNDLIGAWRGKFNDIAFTLTFEDKHNYVMDLFGRKQAGEYEVDFGKHPIQLVITNSGGVKENCIIEFIDREHIRFQNGGPSGPAPEEFSDARLIMLRRMD